MYILRVPLNLDSIRRKTWEFFSLEFKLLTKFPFPLVYERHRFLSGSTDYTLISGCNSVTSPVTGGWCSLKSQQNHSIFQY